MSRNFVFENINYDQRTISLSDKILLKCEKHSMLQTLYTTQLEFSRKSIESHHAARGMPFDSLLYCVEGQGWASSDKGEVPIKRGQFLIIPRNEAIVYQGNSRHPWSFFRVSFSGTLSKAVVEKISEHMTDVHVYTANKAQRVRYFDAIFDLLSNHPNLDRLLKCSRMLWGFLSTFTKDLLSSLIGLCEEASHQDWLVECLGKTKCSK